MKLGKQFERIKNIKKKLPLQVYLAYLLVCTLLLTGITFSKYVTSFNGADSARVAKGLITVYCTDDSSLEMRKDTSGTEKTSSSFSFEVSNNESEVAISYDVVVTLDKALPSGVMIYLDEKQGTNATNDKQEYKFSNVGTFEAGCFQTNPHTLKFEGKLDTITNEDSYRIQISIDSHQID